MERITETVDITPAAPPARPIEDPSREIRLGLVLYGGVSLAIYIYGVVYEFWRLVRASRGEEDNAYSPLLAQADAWATVDIVSGASAGGINGVLLGKALATGADLASVRSLWVEGADFAGLLRNPSEKDPASILRTDRFDELLERGLEQMDRGGTHRELVDVFDLFVPGTRLRPRRRDAIDELGQILKLREYRKIFHLKFRKRGYNEADPSLGYDRNDFRPPMNGVLAQVARATSAFPVAFEPKLIVRDEANRMLFEEGDPHSAWFSDGGILHNKPFT
ncbi:MAG: patatin-like phospholipase family protein, partial [Gaiellaceae bacterium]